MIVGLSSVPWFKPPRAGAGLPEADKQARFRLKLIECIDIFQHIKKGCQEIAFSRGLDKKSSFRDESII